MQKLNFRSDLPKVTVSLLPEVLKHFESNVQTGNSTESGGQLFGTFASPHNVLVSLATGPQKKYHRFRNFLRLDLETDQKEINQFFKQGFHYLGDWHTHPVSNPTPSVRDRNTSKSRFAKSEHELTAMLMVIVGTTITSENLWVGLQNKTTLVELSGVRI